MCIFKELRPDCGDKDKWQHIDGQGKDNEQEHGQEQEQDQAQAQDKE